MSRDVREPRGVGNVKIAESPAEDRLADIFIVNANNVGGSSRHLGR